jgi:transcriptional regulator with XRE-family HTH domain
VEAELGACLRAWRDRLSPEEAGLPGGGRRRRAPGLRRQEVATLAGLSVEYLARLEQGRALHPSTSVIVPLARALRLSDAERNHLLVVAGHAPQTAARAAPHITPALQRILDRLADTPVHVTDDTWCAIYGNRMARNLLGDDFFETEPNVARRYFLGLPCRVADEDGHDDRFRDAIVADLRRALVSSPQREQVRELVDELMAASPEFAERWERGDVGWSRAHHKAVVHPEIGRIEVDCDVLRIDDPPLRIVVYSAAKGSADAQALALLATIGDGQFNESGRRASSGRRS